MTERDIKAFINDDSDMSWQDVSSKLKFISSLKEYEKIDIQSLQTMENGYITSIWRTFFYKTESRKTTYDFVKSVIGNAVMLCAQYLAHNDDMFKKFGLTIYTELQSCKKGINNLCKTYSDDVAYVSKFESIITIIDTTTQGLNLKYNLSQYL